ncbi:MAG: DUF3780 domain-containing protein [Deltaproteobacteria bacterium]|nr:DUF3780 domain-containing protein [Deltaproteobacteria bacterium]
MTPRQRKTTKQKRVLGFGFMPELSEHCFVVTIPSSRAKGAEVLISEHFEWREPGKDEQINVSLTDENAQVKVILRRNVWEEIAEETKAEFNRRLRSMGVKTGKWLKAGQVPVERSLGKELVLLAWAIEDCDPVLISTAVRNWLGLVPEERWWLFTMTNASTGHAVNGRGKGWRKAVRFALTENPVSDMALKRRRDEFKLPFLGQNGSYSLFDSSEL